MNLTIDTAITLKLGFLHLTDCRIAASSETLLKIYDEVANTANERFADTPLGEHPVAGGVRHTSARKGNGHPHRAGAARARRHSNHTNLYARAHARWNGGEKPPWGRAAILRYLTLMP